MLFDELQNSCLSIITRVSLTAPSSRNADPRSKCSAGTRRIPRPSRAARGLPLTGHVRRITAGRHPNRVGDPKQQYNVSDRQKLECECPFGILPSRDDIIKRVARNEQAKKALLRLFLECDDQEPDVAAEAQ